MVDETVITVGMVMCPQKHLGIYELAGVHAQMIEQARQAGQQPGSGILVWTISDRSRTVKEALIEVGRKELAGTLSTYPTK